MGRHKGLKTESSADLFYFWMAAIAFAAFIIGASMTPAMAGAKTVCFSPEFVKKTTKAKSIAPLIAEYDGQAAKEYIDRFNAAGKQTSYVGDHVLEWRAKGRPVFQVVIFNGGCMSAMCIFRVGCKSIPDSPGFKPKEISI